MPNLVNRLVVKELTREFSAAEGLVVISFGALNAVDFGGNRMTCIPFPGGKGKIWHCPAARMTAFTSPGCTPFRQPTPATIMA